MPRPNDHHPAIDAQIIETIPKLRAEHHACTMRAVAATLKMSPHVVRARCMALKQQGIVDWSDMPGSLRMVDQKPTRRKVKKAAVA